MAIQPIDLQTMYSQMSNLAGKVAQEQHSVQNNASVQQQTAMSQNLQQIKTVKKSADTESKTGFIKEDGHQNFQESSSKEKSSSQSNQEEQDLQKKEIREDYLGRHINITR